MFRRSLIALLRPVTKMASTRSLSYPLVRRPNNLFIGPIFLNKFYSINASTHGSSVPEEVRNMSIETYHNISDEFLETLLEQLEDMSDAYPQIMPDVEFSQGVMTFELPSVGTYVVNKQPPNKQIWLASPVSGPNRFDYIDKHWVSLRDGTVLLDVLNKELGDVFPEEDVNLKC